jgi:hypothetical protein
VDGAEELEGQGLLAVGIEPSGQVVICCWVAEDCAGSCVGELAALGQLLVISGADPLGQVVVVC